MLPTTRRIFSQIMLYIKKASTLFDHLLFLFVELLLVCTDVENLEVVDKQEHKYVVLSYVRHAEPSEGPRSYVTKCSRV